MIEEAGGRKVDVTRVKAGHWPNLIAEKETIERVLNIAKKM